MLSFPAEGELVIPATSVGYSIPCHVVTNHPGADSPFTWTASAEKLGDDILLIHDAIPQLSRLVGVITKHEALFGTSTIVTDNETTYDRDRRNSDSIDLKADDCPDDLLLYQLLCRSVEAPFVTAYRQFVNSHAAVHVSSGYSLLRYQEGGFFKEHVDVMRDHPVLGHRRLSVIAFCNDDFDGGELVFPRQGITIKPEPGMMAIFPSGFTHPHESTEITRGTKYSIVSWFY